MNLILVIYSYGDKIKYFEKVGVNNFGREEKRIQGLSLKIWETENAWKT